MLARPEKHPWQRALDDGLSALDASQNTPEAIAWRKRERDRERDAKGRLKQDFIRNGGLGVFLGLGAELVGRRG